jgi:hypothetical protein
MPDSKEISALITAESTSASDLFETALPNAMTETGYISRKATLGTIANFLLSTLQFSSLNTTVKNIIGAINELARGSGQSLDTLNDVDIDAQTLVDGQGIVYDATAQKWKNGTVSGGGHTYSTTEHVVGTWIDGKPIYEKSYPITNTNISTGWNILINNVSDIDTFVSGECALSDSSYGYSWEASYHNNGDIAIYNFLGGDISSANGYVTIQYTKSSS